ncbi:ABC transporter substrate-binding protein [Halospina denitrificans]|nr:ABC transporter substrate-binding protein [Halospina denitrificans]
MDNNNIQARKGLLPTWRGLGRHLGVFLLLSLVSAGSGAEQDRLFFAGGDDPALTELIQSRVEARFGNRLDLAPYNQQTASDALVLTASADALAEVRANNPDQPVVSLFSTSGETKRIIDSAGRFSAIYSDPPLDRQLELGQLIIPRARTVAILSSREQADSFDQVIDSAERLGLEARVFVVSSPDTLIRDLTRALAYGDFVLGTPDSRIFNRNTVKPLLLTSYRRNRLVIGPTRPFVRAGSVASTYTPAEDQVDEGLQLVEAWFETGELPDPRYPDEFQVIINEQVARSMNLPLPGEESLRESLISREDEQ